MKSNRLQAKHLPDAPILHFLAAAGRWCTWGGPLVTNGYAMPSIREAMPPDVEIPMKLQIAKMQQLIRRGLASGCCCGCRGDFEITAKGREWCEANPHTMDGRSIAELRRVGVEDFG